MSAAGRAGAALLALALQAPATSAEGPPCLVSAQLTPQRVVVGEQVVFLARILRRPDVSEISWLEPPSFPSSRAEWLPGRGGGERLWREGTPYLIYEERRAVFPARAGRIELPGARLLCTLHAPAGVPRDSFVARMEGAALEVAALPEAGRPAGFAGLVGRLELHADAAPREAALGESVRLGVLLRGEANLWDAPAPFRELEREGELELFPEPPTLVLEPGERLRARRSFVFDLVPRREGLLRIPPLRVAYFDPRSGRYATAESPELLVNVLPPRPAGAAEAADPAAASAAARAAAAGQPSALRRAALALAVALALAGSFVLGRALRRRLRARRAWAPARAALAEAAAARRRTDAEAEAAALGRALRAALALHLPDARSLAAEELAQRAGAGSALAEAAELLVGLERARFAPPAPDAAPSPLRAGARALLPRGPVRAVVRALRREHRLLSSRAARG